MKILFSILALFVISNGCKGPDALAEKTIKNQTTEVLKSLDTTLVYRASTRGYFDYISIAKDSMIISSDRDLKTTTKYKVSKQDWQSLQHLIKALKIDSLPLLKPPTNRRHYDASYHTVLMIKINDKEVITPTFDHDAPPKMIADIVNKILSVRKSITKK